MQQQLTGAGSFPRKLTAILALAAMSMSGAVWSADNSIYIDQAGDNSTITMTQDGSGNRVKGILTNGSAGGTTDPAKLVGNAQTINIEQKGANNVLSLGSTTTQGGSIANYANIGLNLNYQVTGGNNTGYININNNNQGSSIGSVVSIIQDGGGTASLTMTGTENQVTVNTAGGTGNMFTANINANNIITKVDQTSGGGNETTITQTGNKGYIDIKTLGASNITDIIQNAGGVNGATIKLDYIGSGNETTIQQSNAYDHQADFKIRGNDNTITLAQSGGRVTGSYAKLDLIGASNNNTINITQQGSVDNLTNIKMTNSSNNSITVIQKN
jgi:hypothetical protein